MAARNCLINIDNAEKNEMNLTVKIGDLNSCRQINSSNSNLTQTLPVRWMSPESLIEDVFTNASNVW